MQGFFVFGGDRDKELSLYVKWMVRYYLVDLRGSVWALRWPKHHSNTAAVTALEMESAKARVLVRKLGFSKGILKEDATGVGPAAVRACSGR